MLMISKPVTFVGGKGTVLRIRHQIAIKLDHSSNRPYSNIDSLSSPYFTVEQLQPTDTDRVSINTVALEICECDDLEQLRTDGESFHSAGKSSHLFHITGRSMLELNDCKLDAGKAAFCSLVCGGDEPSDREWQARPLLKMTSSYVTGFKSIGSECFGNVYISQCCFESIAGPVLRLHRPRSVHIVKSNFIECLGTCIQLSAENCQIESKAIIEACDFKRNRKECIYVAPDTYINSLLEVRIEDCTFTDNSSHCVKAYRSESTILKLTNCSFVQSKKSPIEIEDCGQRSEIVSNFFSANEGTCISCLGSPIIVFYNEMVENWAGISASCSQQRAKSHVKYVDRFLNHSTDSMSHHIGVELYKNTIKSCFESGIEIYGISYFTPKIANNLVEGCKNGILIDTVYAGPVPEERLECESTSVSLGCSSSRSTDLGYSSTIIRLLNMQVDNCKQNCLRVADHSCMVILAGGRFSSLIGNAISLIGKNEDMLKVEVSNVRQTLVDGKVKELDYFSQPEKSQCSLI